MNKINPNMGEGALINPFTHFENGQCPKCSGPIVVVQSEMSSSLLSENGLPINYKLENFRISGYCTNCNRPFPIVKNGMEFEVVTDLDFKLKLDRAMGREPKDNDVDIEYIEDNPFGK